MSSPMIIAGRLGAREVGYSSTRSREGYEIVKTLTGPVDDIKAIEPSIWGDGAIQVTVSQQPGSCLATLTARYSAASTPVGGGGGGSEALISQEVTTQYSSVPIPIKQHAYFADLPIDGIVTIDDAVENKLPFPANGAGLNNDTRWEEYYLLMRIKSDTFEAKLPVVRYVLKCAPQFTGLLDTINVGTVFTKEQVTERVADTILFTIAEPTEVFLADAYGFFVQGWRLEATLGFDVDGNGILEETYTWGQFVRMLHKFDFDPDA